LGPDTIKGSQVRDPLFEFSGACAGCAETPYLKLLSQMFGDRILVANAGSSSDLRSQPADHTVVGERRRPRAGLGQLAVRGQRRVRTGLLRKNTGGKASNATPRAAVARFASRGKPTGKRTRTASSI
jgi:pyruvate/2-oxoacid:ferredoxin oxidoreductase beta subunit